MSQILSSLYGASLTEAFATIKIVLKYFAWKTSYIYRRDIY